MEGCTARIASLDLDGRIRVSCSQCKGCLREGIANGIYIVKKDEVFEGECYTEEGPQGQRSRWERETTFREQREIFHL